MSEVLHANIFFVVATIAVVVFCVLVSLVLFQVFKIVKLVRTILERIQAGSEIIAEDVAHMRSLVANGSMISRAFQFFTGSSGRRDEPKSRKRPRVN